MRRVAWLAGIVVVCACKRTPPAPGPAGDAGATLVRAEPSSIARAPEADAAPDAARPNLPPLPLASDQLELVAVGKKWGGRILSLTALGDHVWLSAIDLDAHADGDGPLAKGPDPIAKLPYHPKTDRVEVVGKWPVLFALRTKNIESRMESPEPTVFAFRDGKWSQGRRLAKDWFPHAFVPWGDGALVVDSQVMGNAMPYHDGKTPGTTLQLVKPDGSIEDAKIPLDDKFLAWEASSDGTTLSILGTIAKGKGWSDEAPKGPVVIVRGKAGEKPTTIRLFEDASLSMESYASRVRESGSSVVAFLMYASLLDAWKPGVGTMYVASGGAVQKRVVPMPNDLCGYEDAAIAGGVVYAIRRCMEGTNALYALTVVRVPESGTPTQLAVPKLARADGGGFRVATPDDKATFACLPRKLTVRPPGDLWMTAECGKEAGSDSPGIPAVFRLGRPQAAPVVIP